MSYEDWLFEYEGLRMREEQADTKMTEVYRMAFRDFTRTLVALLGIELKKTAPDEPVSFVPLSLLVGRPEIMKEFRKLQTSEEAALDEQANAASDFVMNTDFGDMEPMFDFSKYDELEKEIDDQRHQRLLRAMGVEIVSESDIVGAGKIAVASKKPKPRRDDEAYDDVNDIKFEEV